MEAMIAVDHKKLNHVREELKKLVELQMKEKKLLRTDHRKIEKVWSVQGRTVARAVDITAHLNMRRILVGKEPCHNVREGWQWIYDKTFKELESFPTGE